MRPDLPSRASGWSSLTTRKGFPCCARFPYVHALATTPAQRLGAYFALFPSRFNLPRNGGRVGLCNDLFEACSAFTHVRACTLALSPYVVTPFTGGFNHFVTSTVAPVASGWSGCRVGLSPTGKRRLVTAHAMSGRRLKEGLEPTNTKAQSSKTVPYDLPGHVGV